jgi:hypothetical protein
MLASGTSPSAAASAADAALRAADSLAHVALCRRTTASSSQAHFIARSRVCLQLKLLATKFSAGGVVVDVRVQ